MSAHPRGQALLDALESGEVRVAEPRAGSDFGAWQVHAWVKEGILELFRSGAVVAHGPAGVDPAGHFTDKADLPARAFAPDEGVRLVPGGSAVRRGAHIASGCVLMPPCYVNVGAFVGAGSMIDSHALVGSCAQLGQRVHLSAGAQVGGVLEPVGALPVIVEDDVLVGANTGLFEGVRVGRGAVLAAGVQLTASTPIFDLVREEELRGAPGRPLVVPPGAVVVPGARPATGEWARERSLHVACALIAKYRDERTDAATALEDALR